MKKRLTTILGRWFSPEYFYSNAFAWTTRDREGKRLEEIAAISRRETAERLSEINLQIRKMQLIVRKANKEFAAVKSGSVQERDLAMRCTLALENCVRLSVQNDMLLETIHSSADPFFMDRRHKRYAQQLDEIAIALSSIVKIICND